MPNSNLLLIDPTVLPEVFRRVVDAKRLLASGEAKTASEAARMAGISRSAFYKYKDSVFSFSERAGGRIITIHAVLRDKAGVLSTLISTLYRQGANILTVNQNIPVGGAALVSISIRTDMLKAGVAELIGILRQIDGVLSIDQILGE